DGRAPAQEGEDVDLMRGELAREPDRDIRIQPPVEGALEGAVRSGHAPARLAVVLRVEGDDVADRVAAGEKQRAPVDRVRAREKPGSEDAAGCGGGRGDRARVLFGRGERRLAVDVAAGGERILDDLAVQVRRRRDDDALDVRALVEQLAVVVEGSGAGGALEAGSHAGGDDVANGRDLDRVELAELVQDRAALPPDADDGEPLGLAAPARRRERDLGCNGDGGEGAGGLGNEGSSVSHDYTGVSRDLGCNGSRSRGDAEKRSHTETRRTRRFGGAEALRRCGDCAAYSGLL